MNLNASFLSRNSQTRRELRTGIRGAGGGLLILPLCLCLSACAEQSLLPEAGSAAVPAPGSFYTEITPAAAAASSETRTILSSQTERDARPLSEDEVIEAYRQAVTAYGWFDLANLPTEGPDLLYCETVYQKVSDPDFQTLEDLRIYLHRLFSEELTDALLDESSDCPPYISHDGALYARPHIRGADITRGNCALSVEQESASEYFVNVSIEILDENDLIAVTEIELYAFPYRFENGRWVFSEFHLMY